MTDRMMVALRGLALAGGLLTFGSGCETQGPAEKAGEAIDNAARDAGDALDKDGPIEDAAERIENP